MEKNEALNKLKFINDTCHVFINPNGMLIGADWSKKEIIELLDSGKISLSGTTATKMGHGIAVFNYGKYHFLETN